LEEALQLAVLAVSAMHEREDDVQPLFLWTALPAGAVQPHERGHGGVREERGVLSRLAGDALLQEPVDLGRRQPLAALGDPDRHDLVAVRIDRGEERARGDERHLVLDRAAPEDDPEPDLLHGPLSSIPGMARILCTSGSGARTSSTMV